jgi:3-oxoacyl-[acyl-carrier protein] reductase
LEKPGRLAGKVALVTGSSRGIGRQIALQLAREGAFLSINYHKSEESAKHLSDEIAKLGTECIRVKADLSRNEDIQKMISTVERDLGSVEILVNNAGISKPQKLQDITEKDWDEIIQLNLKSAFLITQEVLPKMREKKWGRIIYISSVAAQLGGVIGPHYAASKAGLIGLTHSYANILSKEGITVNAIAPALIATDMVTNNKNARPDLIPVGRFGTVEEVADVVVMVVCNGYITGQTINVNGGWYMS